MNGKPSDIADRLNDPQQRFLRAMVRQGVGVGVDNAASIDKVLGDVLPAHQEASESEIGKLEEEGVLQTFSSKWVAFTPSGRKTASHLSQQQQARDRGENPLPFEVQAPKDQDWRVEARFLKDIDFVRKDASLREALKTAVETILRGPERYPETTNAGRFGNLYKRNVTNNFRILWGVEGNEAVFVAFISRGHPLYAD